MPKFDKSVQDVIDNLPLWQKDEYGVSARDRVAVLVSALQGCVGVAGMRVAFVPDVPVVREPPKGFIWFGNEGRKSETPVSRWAYRRDVGAMGRVFEPSVIPQCDGWCHVVPDGCFDMDRNTMRKFVDWQMTHPPDGAAFPVDGGPDAK